jgi:hypothetical protein
MGSVGKIPTVAAPAAGGQFRQDVPRLDLHQENTRAGQHSDQVSEGVCIVMLRRQLGSPQFVEAERANDGTYSYFETTW